MRCPETTCFELLTVRTDQSFDKSREIGLAPSIPFHLARLRTTSGTGLTIKSGRPALECIPTKVSIIVPLHTSSSFDDVSSPKESTKSLENSKKEDSTTPFWCPPSRSSREAHATIVDERGWNIRAKKMGAFRFCNEIGYRRYNSRSVNPSIIVSAAITLPRLTII